MLYDCILLQVGSYRVEVDWLYSGSNQPSLDLDYYEALGTQLQNVGVDYQVILFTNQYPYGFEVLTCSIFS